MNKSAVFVGLSRREVEESRRKNGENRIVSKKKKGLFSLVLSGLLDPIILVLLASVGINIVFSFGSLNWYETGGILAAVVISTFVSAFSEHSSSKAFEKMQQESEAGRCCVLREGKFLIVPFVDVVVGDLIKISGGEKIPADGVLVQGKLSVDQSALNGENTEAEKSPDSGGAEKEGLLNRKALFQGSLCVSGEGIMRVQKVGAKTLYGEIADQLSEKEEPSPLKIRLNRLAEQLCQIGYFCAILIALVSLFSSFVIEGGYSLAGTRAILSDPRAVVAALLHAFSLAITVVVVAVPEGLPMMISVVLSANRKRMLRDHVLVRKPVGIETCGSMNLLFTDKTGTLTCGNHRVTSLFLGDGKEYREADFFRREKLFSLFSRSAYCNTDAFWQKGKAVGGNFTDRALLEFAGKTPPKGSFSAEKKIPFNSTDKFSAVFGSFEGKKQGFIKGAPEKLLPQVKRFFAADGSLKPFDKKEALRQKIKEKSAQGLRLILVASCDASLQKLDLIGIFCISDPLRADSRKSVEELQGAGIRVVMITGDSLETAKKIAADCRILPPSGQGICLEGEALRKLSEEELGALLPRLCVVARALPSDKSLLIRVAQKKGLVVGMTGDGVNDAPALKRADVGFSMGAGSVLAQEAGDIVILDNSLSAIGKAVLYGRTIFKSIRKFIVFQLTMNFIAVGISIFGIFAGIENPITIMQMLWLNLIMDTLGGIAFAGEAPLSSTMREKPKKKSEGILSSYMVVQIAGVVVFSAALLLFFLFSSTARAHFAGENETYFMTVFFSIFIFIAVLNCFQARTSRIHILSSLWRNPAFCLVILFVVAVQILIVYRGGAVFSTVPILPRHLLEAFGIAFSVLPFGMLLKGLLRACKKPHEY